MHVLIDGNKSLLVMDAAPEEECKAEGGGERSRCQECKQKSGDRQQQQTGSRLPSAVQECAFERCAQRARKGAGAAAS